MYQKTVHYKDYSSIPTAATEKIILGLQYVVQTTKNTCLHESAVYT